MSRVAMVAAMEREVRPLVRGWRAVDREYDGRRFRFFDDGAATVLVCGGIGPEAARRAAEAVIAIYQPQTLQSVGFAGALDPTLRVGDIFSPGRVIDAKDGSSTNLNGSTGTLLSVASIANLGQKVKLAEAYGAHAIDMEAAAVATSAARHGIRFAVTKVVSDEFDFAMPDMNQFVDDGQFRLSRFLAFVAVRPQLWARVMGMARRSSKAAHALCRELERQRIAQSRETPELASPIRV